MTTLRLILGDRINPEYSWFSVPDEHAVFVLTEVRQEANVCCR